MTDGTGSTTYTYNAVNASVGSGRLATETGPLGSTAAIAYTYDSLGRVTATAINSISSGVTYDSLNRITAATNPLGTFTYGYVGSTPRLQTISNNQNGLNSSYSYQAAGQDYRLTDLSNYSSGTTVLSKFDYTYNADGAIASWQEQTDSNTPTLWNYQYDNADQLKSATRLNTATSAVLSQYVYGYDPAGNRTSEQIGLGVTATAVNNLNQITSSGAGGPLQFTGTLSKPAQVTVGGNAATTGYSTNFAGNANVTTGTNTVAVVAQDVDGNAATNNYQVVVPTGGTVTPIYDSDGNLTNNGNGQTYTWDARNELLSITYASGATSLFTYDGLGRRVKIVEKNSSGTVTSTKQFVWVGATMVEERDASDNVTKRFFAQGEQIAGTNYYYTRDHLGSIREMVDNSGTIQARYDYDPYGRTTLVSGTNLSDFQYGGYYTHQTSGLNLTMFRAYDPNTAKWLSRDPIGSASMVMSLSMNGRPYSLKKVPDLNPEMLVGPNLYSYVWNDPVDLHDPEGLCGLSPCVKGCIEDAGGDWALAALGISSTTAGTLPKVFGAGALGSGNLTTGLSYANYGLNRLGIAGTGLRAAGRALNPIGDAITVGAAGYLLGLLIGCEATCANQ
jgi:RHS repeat-associated protein